MRRTVILLFSFLSLAAWAKNTPVAVESQPPAADMIKSCLVDLYIAQQKYLELNDTYAHSTSDLKLKSSKACGKIKISFAKANAENFTVVGQLENEQWSLDETKSLTQIQ